MPGELLNKGDVIPTIVDTGATISATGNQNAFVPGTLKEMEEPWELEGIGGTLKVTHTGLLNLEVVADDGSIVKLTHEAGYMPDLKCNLLSPQSYAMYRKTQLQDTEFEYSLKLSGLKFKYANSTTVSIVNDPSVRLPILPCFIDATQTAYLLAVM